MQNKYDIGIELNPPLENLPRRKWYKLIYDSYAHPVKSIRGTFLNRKYLLYVIAIVIYLISAQWTLIFMIGPENLFSPISTELIKSGFLLFLTLLFFVPVILIPKLDYFLLYAMNITAYSLNSTADAKESHILQLFKSKSRNIFSAFLNAQAPLLIFYSLFILIHQIIQYSLYKYYNNGITKIPLMIYTFSIDNLPFIMIAIWSVWLFFTLIALGVKTSHNLLNTIIISVVNILLLYLLWHFFHNGLWAATHKLIYSGNNSSCLIVNLHANYIFFYENRNFILQ